MSIFQYVVLGLGALLILSSFMDIGKLFEMLKSKINTPVTPNKPDAPEPIVENATPSLSSLVSKWEALRSTCQESGMETSVKELDDVFPTFLDFVQKAPKSNAFTSRK